MHVLPPTRARHISRISSSVILMNAHDAFRPVRTVRIAVPRLCTVEISSGLSAHSSVPAAFEPAPSSRIAGATADASDATPVKISLSLGMSSTPISGARNPRPCARRAVKRPHTATGQDAPHLVVVEPAKALLKRLQAEVRVAVAAADGLVVESAPRVGDVAQALGVESAEQVVALAGGGR